MAIKCTTALKGIAAASCLESAIGGTSGDAILIPHANLAKPLSVANGQFDAVELKAGTKGVLFEAYPNSITGEFSLSAGTYVNKYQHKVTVRLFLRHTEVREVLNMLTNGNFLVLVRAKGTESGGDAKSATQLEAYGAVSGMTVSELSGSTDLADGVAYTVVFQSKEPALEPYVPAGFVSETGTDLTAATDALITSLTAPKG